MRTPPPKVPMTNQCLTPPKTTLGTNEFIRLTYRAMGVTDSHSGLQIVTVEELNPAWTVIPPPRPSYPSLGVLLAPP